MSDPVYPTPPPLYTYLYIQWLVHTRLDRVFHAWNYRVFPPCIPPPPYLLSWHTKHNHCVWCETLIQRQQLMRVVFDLLSSIHFCFSFWKWNWLSPNEKKITRSLISRYFFLLDLWILLFWFHFRRIKKKIVFYFTNGWWKKGRGYAGRYRYPVPPSVILET
jgi:hypothetical protein